MHQTGVRMTNEVIRGDEVFHKAVADVYDFDQQGKTVWQPLPCGLIVYVGIFLLDNATHLNFCTLSSSSRCISCVAGLL